MACSWIILLPVLMLAPACHAFGDILGQLTKEVPAVAGPVEKIASGTIFAKCKEVKELLGLDFKNIKDDRNMSNLMVSFYAGGPQVVKYSLSDLSSVCSSRFFKKDKPLVIYFHGFLDSPNLLSKEVIERLIYKDVGNVLALDASPVIGMLYLRSSTLVRYVGDAVGQALIDMIRGGHVKQSDIYLIGHSLGAHIAGFAGKTVSRSPGMQVGRITGLDPAGPCFAEVEQDLKLNKNDAAYVDVIHTDAGVFGLGEPLGHADYYPNRGSEQPGCLFPACSHLRSWMYYAESLVNEKGFPAVECQDWKAFKDGHCDYKHFSIMGYASEPGTEGQFYLQTATKVPFALGANSIGNTQSESVVRNIRDYIGLGM